MKQISQPVLPIKFVLKKRLLQAGWILLATYLAVCGILACCQRRLIYHPPVVTTAVAEQDGRKANLERWTDSAGAKIGWRRLSPRQPALGRALVVYGSGSCMESSAHFVDEVQYPCCL